MFFAERPFPCNSYGNGVSVHTNSVGTVTEQQLTEV